MDTMLPLASALGLGMLAGARLYATVFVLGLLIRFDWMTLPEGWQQASALGDLRVLAITGAACAIEFVADKIPWLDSAWDAVHAFVRPIGAVVVASSLFSNLEPAWQMLLLVLTGGMAITGHTAKAATRLVVNQSPEPVSNAAVSLAEDAAVAGGIYLLVEYPWVLAAIALVFLAVFAWLAPRVYRALRAEWIALRALVGSWMGPKPEPRLTPTQAKWLRKAGADQAPGTLFEVISTGDLKGLRHSAGTLRLAGRDAVFFTRRWGRLVAVSLGPYDGIETSRNLLMDELALVEADGARTRFDLLAGQRARLREAVSHRTAGR